jgi:tetratricopeptide (TPR) repeat protein
MFRAFRLLVAPVLLVVFSTAARADLNSANAAYNRGDYGAAVAEYRQLALAGDPVAMYNLGQAYKLGRGVPLDPNIAADWYRKAAEHNPPLAEAQDAYGLMLFQSGKRQEAIPYIQRSADRGDPRAQYVLGTAYFNGDLVRKDNVKAFAYMTLASASQNLPKAGEALATMQAYIPLPEQEKGQQLASEMRLGAQRQQLAQLDNAPRTIGPDPIRTEAVPPSTAPGVTFSDAMPAPAPTPPTVRTKTARVVKPVPARVIPTIKAPPPPAPESAATETVAPVEQVKPFMAAPAGRYRVQLGAFSDQGKAQAYGEALLARNAAFNALKFYLVRAGAVTRLQAGPLASKAAAEQLCASVKAHGSGCLVVNP